MLLVPQGQSRKIVLIILILLWLAGLAWLIWAEFFRSRLAGSSANYQPAVCAADAKLCPDGSFVARVAPACEFAACPEVASTPANVNWSVYTDEKQNLTFEYPSTLSADYVSTVNWPPTVSVGDGAFSCDETPGESSLPSRTLQRLVDDRTYCVTAMSEGAAGSVYTDYAYTTEQDSRLITVSFTLRYPECLNYDDSQKTACQNEREAFDLDSLVDRIASTIKFGN